MEPRGPSRARSSLLFRRPNLVPFGVQPGGQAGRGRAGGNPAGHGALLTPETAGGDVRRGSGSGGGGETRAGHESQKMSAGSG